MLLSAAKPTVLVPPKPTLLTPSGPGPIMTPRSDSADVPGVTGYAQLKKVVDDLGKGPAVPTAVIVATDGGGVAGIVESCVLEGIEAALNKLARNDALKKGAIASLSEERISKYITLAAMNSAGGLALAPLVMKNPKTAKQNRIDFQNRAWEVFPTDMWRALTTIDGWLAAKYSPTGLEKVVKESVGDRKISESVTDAIAMTTTRGTKSVPLVVTSFKTGAGEDDYYWRDVVRCSSAAPGVFPAGTLKPVNGGPSFSCWDGALWANNPSLAAYVFSQVLYPKAQRIVVLSLGSGEANSAVESVSSNSGLLELAPELLRSVMGASTDSAAYMMGIVAALAQIEVVYVRVNPQLVTTAADKTRGIDTSWTNGDKLNMDKYVAQMNEFATQNPELYEMIAKLLRTATAKTKLQHDATTDSQQTMAKGLAAQQFNALSSRLVMGPNALLSAAGRKVAEKTA
jgi:patatin-like phospholipase/acyl hydrolase